MENDITIVEDVRPSFFRSRVAEAPFDVAYRRITNNPPYSCRIISLRENAILRRSLPEDHNVSRLGNMVREGVIYFPGGTPKIVSYSPILRRPEEATNGHQSGATEVHEFYPSEEEIESALKHSVDFPREYFEIPTSRFGEDPLTNFIFESDASLYGQFLRDAGVDAMPAIPFDSSTVNWHKRLFVTQIYFGSLLFDEKSCLNASQDIYLSENQRVRGIERYNVVPARNSNPSAYKA